MRTLAAGGFAVMSTDKNLWNKLLPAIAQGQVIPIVGRDLLRLDIGGHEQLLHDYLAMELAARLDVTCEPGATLDEVAGAFLAVGRNERTDIYLAAVDILKGLRDPLGRLPVPEPLRQLAGIDALRLFITTTTDPLLAVALESPPDYIFAYAPNAEVTDIPRDYARSPHRTVFHLFGRLSAIPDSAMIEEDTLEFIWNLHEESTRRLVNLFDELRSKRLLLIGNGQADWLARFFVRLARRERLFSGRDAREFVADERVAADARLRGFLEHFSPQTRPFSARDPIAFVAQLAEKWDAYPDKPRATSERPAVGTPGKPPAVFLSYASQDYPAVERLRMHLDGAGLDVWFDKKRLESGDPWWPVIEQNIATCDVFLPIVSASSNARSEGIVFREWNRALARLEDMDKKTARFIHPVIVDDTAEGDVTFSGFQDFHFTRATNGEPAGEFVQHLVGLVRERRARRAARA
jgi:hypothetical protein